MSHKCDNLVIICMDFRFQDAINDWASGEMISGNYDLVSLAGAQKALLDEDTKETVLKQIKLSVDLHGTKQIIFIAHQDCGAYGGSGAFADWGEEKKQYIYDMTKAESIVKEMYPDLSVKKVLLTYEGDKINFETV